MESKKKNKNENKNEKYNKNRKIAKVIKRARGVTMLALVVTIIVLLILAAITLSLAVGENGIIERAKLARDKAKNASTAEEEAMNEATGEIDNAENGGSSGGGGTGEGICPEIEEQKEQIADLEGQLASKNEELTRKDETIKKLQETVDNLNKQIEELNRQIETLKAKQATGNATVSEVLAGKTFSNSNGVGLVGTMANNGALSKTLNAGQSYTIPVGYHNGSGKVTAASLESQTAGTATAEDILEGKTAWINGKKVTGNKKENEGIESITFKMHAYTTENPNYWQSSIKDMDITKFNTLTIGDLTGGDAHNSSGVIIINADGKSLLNGVATGNKTIDISEYSKLDITIQGRYAKTMALPVTLSK